MTVVIVLCLLGLGIAGALAAARVLRPGNVPDRAIALDTLVLTVIGVLAVLVVSSGSGLAIDLALVAGLLAFLGTLTAARYVEERGP